MICNNDDTILSDEEDLSPSSHLLPPCDQSVLSKGMISNASLPIKKRLAVHWHRGTITMSRITHPRVLHSKLNETKNWKNAY
jgi:hypothetical protein